MILLDWEIKKHLSRRNGVDVCFIKDAPPEIVKHLKALNAEYRKFNPLHHDFIELSQFQNVLAHLVKKLFFQRQTHFDASTVIFS